MRTLDPRKKYLGEVGIQIEFAGLRTQFIVIVQQQNNYIHDEDTRVRISGVKG
jgi:hypothetical protein